MVNDMMQIHGFRMQKLIQKTKKKRKSQQVQDE